MKHSYTLEGMTCSSCEARVTDALSDIEGITGVSVSKDSNSAEIEMTKHVDLNVLQLKLADLDEKYSIAESVGSVETTSSKPSVQQRSWFETYKPVLLIFIYIFAVSSAIEILLGSLEIMRWMRHFMAGFFLTFSFFKMLNLKGFKNSYQMYDIIARRFPAWGYIYAFTELILGLAFLINFNPVITSAVTLTVMSVSIIGVLQTVLNKKVIQCACLGDVFNLPMSTVTIIEDGLMIVMSASMLYMALT